jgi:hypothetical protein
MMPLSYQGFGFTAIMLMVAILVFGQLFRKPEDRPSKQDGVHD